MLVLLFVPCAGHKLIVKDVAERAVAEVVAQTGYLDRVHVLVRDVQLGLRRLEASDHGAGEVAHAFTLLSR